MRFHVVALPHTQTSKHHNLCAYTMKVFNFCWMMHSLGHEVYHYGAEGSEVDGICTEHIEIISRKEQEEFFGEENLLNFYPLDWDPNKLHWQLTNHRAAVEITKRKQKGDFICIIAGWCNHALAEAVNKNKDVIVVEYGIGYDGSFADYRVFESYSHMHKVYGAQKGFDPDGRWYDVVIPNYFDPEDFPPKFEKGDYYLFIGRLIKRKGLEVAVETCNRIGAKLVIVGQGCKAIRPGEIETQEGDIYRGPGLSYEGIANLDRRKALYQNAIATFVPTIYIEPFGGVAVESQMCGTPVITTDYGAFTETVEHGITGYRCRTLDHFVFATKHVRELDLKYIHNRAVANYSTDRVRYMYQEYFQMLSDIDSSKGWYTERERKQLDWLVKRNAVNTDNQPPYDGEIERINGSEVNSITAFSSSDSNHAKKTIHVKCPNPCRNNKPLRIGT